MVKAIKQFSITSAVYFSLMGIYLASQAMGFKPSATLALLD